MAFLKPSLPTSTSRFAAVLAKAPSCMYGAKRATSTLSLLIDMSLIAMHTALILSEVCREVAAILKRVGELVHRLRIIDAVLAGLRVVVQHVVDELPVVVEVEIFAIYTLDAAIVMILACELAVTAVALVGQLRSDEVGRESRVLRDRRSDIVDRQARQVGRRSAAVIGCLLRVLCCHAVARLNDLR